MHGEGRPLLINLWFEGLELSVLLLILSHLLFQSRFSCTQSLRGQNPSSGLAKAGFTWDKPLVYTHQALLLVKQKKQKILKIRYYVINPQLFPNSSFWFLIGQHFCSIPKPALHFFALVSLWGLEPGSFINDFAKAHLHNWFMTLLLAH